MKKFFKIACFIILLLIIAHIIYLHTLYDYNFYSSLIEIPIPIFAKMEEKDMHGGFHGDGETLAKFYFSDKQAKELTSNISNNSHWNKLPIPEILQECAYNSIDEDIENPFIKKPAAFKEESERLGKFNFSWRSG